MMFVKQKKMADESLRHGTLLFSGVECSVRMSVQNGSQLTVEVEQHSTADQWHNTFDAKCQYCIHLLVCLFVP